MPDAYDWVARHARAWALDSHPIVPLIKAWVKYADAHKEQHGDVIGEDAYGGPLWYDAGRSILGLLNMDTGVLLDCGTMDALIRDTMTKHGMDGDTA